MIKNLSVYKRQRVSVEGVLVGQEAKDTFILRGVPSGRSWGARAPPSLCESCFTVFLYN